MSYTGHRAAMETAMATAHRQLARAIDAADCLGDDGAYLDLMQIQVELTRVAEHSLKSKPGARPQLKGQPSSH